MLLSVVAEVDYAVIRIADLIVQRKDSSVEALLLDQIEINIGDDDLLLIDVAFRSDLPDSHARSSKTVIHAVLAVVSLRPAEGRAH